MTGRHGPYPVGPASEWRLVAVAGVGLYAHHGDRLTQVPGLLQRLRQPLHGLLPSVCRGVGAQFPHPAVPGHQVGKLMAAVERGDLPTANQLDGLVRTALALADRREQGDRRVGFDIAASPRQSKHSCPGSTAEDLCRCLAEVACRECLGRDREVQRSGVTPTPSEFGVLGELE